MTDDTTSDRFLRKATILSEIPIHESTLWEWIRDGRFPKPVVLNPGAGREIVAWPESVYRAWKAALPVRQAKVITDKAYEKRRKPKPKLTRPTTKASPTSTTPPEVRDHSSSHDEE